MRKIILSLLALCSIAMASEHGIYFKVIADAGKDLSAVTSQLRQVLNSSDYVLLADRSVKTPDYLVKDNKTTCGFKAHLFVLQDVSYTNYLTGFGDKYLVGAFLKVAVYQTPAGVQVNICDPETINRIVFNDLDDTKYEQAVKGTKPFRDALIKTVQKIDLGDKVQIPMEPIRSDEDLREASKDMFMMVGPMTLFDDEDQFPVIYRSKAADATSGIQETDAFLEQNLSAFKADKDDRAYQWSPKDEDLQWQIEARIFNADSTALLLGISRPRTEALSFKIAGKPRVNKTNSCPGIDHATAYPVEVLLTYEDGEVVVRTAREMFRMDMYFWDAGKMAFMEYMNMPKMLDQSIKMALLGK